MTQLSAQLQYKLIRYRDNYGMELNEFIYNVQHQMIAVHVVMTGDYEYYDSLKYDDRGNLVKLSGWQLLDGRYKNVYYIDYTYDDNNRMTSRKNYNLFGKSWELGGTYTYTYDAQGHCTLAQLRMGGSLFQEIQYTYQGDLMIDETWYDKDMLEMVASEKITYYYNDSNRLTSMYDSIAEQGNYSLYKYHLYTYDQNGNCISHKGYDNRHSEVERHIYTYTDMLMSETLMPYTPELTKPADTKGNANVYSTEEFWTLDDNFTLQHLCNYSYEYIGINENAVENVVIEQVNNIRKIMVDGRIYIERGDELYDLSGRRLR